MMRSLFNLAFMVMIVREDNAMGLDLARSVAPYFRVAKGDADAIIANSQVVVKQWPKIAAGLHIPRREQDQHGERVSPAGLNTLTRLRV